MDCGIFSGNPKTEWLCENGEDRDMRLLEAFWYTDPNGRRWEAPKGAITNGASIPRTLWSSVGSPFTGGYRRAAIVHDVALRSAGIVRDDADSMFFHACMAGGCAPLDCKLLYAGVRIGSWATLAGIHVDDWIGMAPGLPGQHGPTELEIRARYTLLAAALAATGNDLDAIRAVVARHLGANR
jgi:hypothetical protein